MNPALSVVLFTTLSGTGLGLLVVLGVMQARAPLPLSRELALIPLLAGVALLLAGLASSFAHLGQPQRAWRAFTQWRSSWLSREAVAALLTILSAAALGLLTWNAGFGTAFTVTALLVSLLSVATVVATARIYDTLVAIPAWTHRLVLPIFVSSALACGAPLLWLLLSLAMWELPRWASYGLLATVAGFTVLQIAYWRHVDRNCAVPSTGAMTGLASIGPTRAAEAPHTEANYLLREMGFVLARKHGRRLRVLSVSLLVISMGAIAFGGLWSRSSGTLAAGTAVTANILAVFITRWLFFAQARHTVISYYGPNRG